MEIEWFRFLCNFVPSMRHAYGMNSAIARMQCRVLSMFANQLYECVRVRLCARAFQRIKPVQRMYRRGLFPR